MPGRARLRVPKATRTPAHVKSVAGRVGRSSRVHDVETNDATGSVLVSFDADDPIDMLIDELREAGLEVLSATPGSSGVVRTQSTSAAVVTNVMSRANAKLHEMTHGHADLRLAVPAVYTVLALRAFMRQRGRLRGAEWYQLLYWAFDSFFKLHEERTVRGASRSDGRVVD